MYKMATFTDWRDIYALGAFDTLFTVLVRAPIMLLGVVALCVNWVIFILPIEVSLVIKKLSKPGFILWICIWLLVLATVISANGSEIIADVVLAWFNLHSYLFTELVSTISYGINNVTKSFTHMLYVALAAVIYGSYVVWAVGVNRNYIERRKANSESVGVLPVSVIGAIFLIKKLKPLK